MSAVLLVTHGNLAAELLAAAEKIAGVQSGMHALCLDWDLGIDGARERLAAEVAALDRGEGVLILTDMFGDTPSNATLGLIESGRVEMLSGVNLPMVVRLACGMARQRPLDELARWLEIKGRRSIRRAGALETGPLPSDGTAGD